MNTLALDLGTKTGWAVRSHEKDAPVLSGVWDLKGGRFEGGGMRFLRFKSRLEETHGLNPIGRIAYEEVRRHKGTDAAHIYGGLQATLSAWAEVMKIPYEGLPVGAIKKHATGKGNCGKPAIIAAMRKRGFAPCDDNEADALAILMFALEVNQ